VGTLIGGPTGLLCGVTQLSLGPSTAPASCEASDGLLSCAVHLAGSLGHDQCTGIRVGMHAVVLSGLAGCVRLGVGFGVGTRWCCKLAS
jgi:hypothetical protein